MVLKMFMDAQKALLIKALKHNPEGWQAGDFTPVVPKGERKELHFVGKNKCFLTF
jgi:hypothetical protein